LSFYGIIIVIANSKIEIDESLIFDNIKEFYVFREPGVSEINWGYLVENKRIMLKRTKMSDEPFSFKCTYKAGTKTA